MFRKHSSFVLSVVIPLMLQDVQKALQFCPVSRHPTNATGCSENTPVLSCQSPSHHCYRMFRKHFSFALSVVIPLMLQDVQKALQFCLVSRHPTNATGCSENTPVLSCQSSSHQCYRMFRKHSSFALSVVIPLMLQDVQKSLQFCPVSRHPTSAPCPHLIITTPRLFLSLGRHSNRHGVVSKTPKLTFIIRSQISGKQEHKQRLDSRCITWNPVVTAMEHSRADCVAMATHNRMRR
jgi:hypothetical protein